MVRSLALVSNHLLNTSFAFLNAFRYSSVACFGYCAIVANYKECKNIDLQSHV